MTDDFFNGSKWVVTRIDGVEVDPSAPNTVEFGEGRVAGQVGVPGGQGTVNGQETPAWVAFTYPFNMTRSPAGTVCAGFTDGGLPVGLQVVGPQHADVAVLRALALLEDALAIDRLAPL